MHSFLIPLSYLYQVDILRKPETLGSKYVVSLRNMKSLPGQSANGEIDLKVAIFDFDGTLITRDTLPCLGKDWLRQKRSRTRYFRTYLSAIPHVIMWKAGLLSRERMKVRVVHRFNRIFKGLTHEDIEHFFEEAYPTLKELFNPLVINEITSAQREGFYTILLSGAYTELLRIVGEDLGFDCVIGVELPLSNGSFDHHRRAPLIDGKAKLRLLQEHFVGQEIDWQASRSYGDSYDDLRVLEIVGEPVAVNAEPRLASYAQKRKWRIL